MPDTNQPPPATAPTTIKPGTPAAFAGPSTPIPPVAQQAVEVKAGQLSTSPKSYSEVGAIRDPSADVAQPRDWPVLILGWVFGLATSVIVAVRVAKITNNSADERAKKDRNLNLKKDVYLEILGDLAKGAQRIRGMISIPMEELGHQWSNLYDPIANFAKFRLIASPESLQVYERAMEPIPAKVKELANDRWELERCAHLPINGIEGLKKMQTDYQINKASLDIRAKNLAVEMENALDEVEKAIRHELSL